MSREQGESGRVRDVFAWRCLLFLELFGPVIVGGLVGMARNDPNVGQLTTIAGYAVELYNRGSVRRFNGWFRERLRLGA